MPDHKPSSSQTRHAILMTPDLYRDRQGEQTMTRPHGTAYAAIAMVLTLGLAACGGSNGATNEPTPMPPSTSAPVSPTPTATKPATPEEKATAQLTAYLEVRDDALRDATINFERLNKVATGREFLNIQQHASAIERSGGKVTGEYVHTLAGPRNRGTYILITDCEDRSAVVNTNKEGKPVPETKDPEGNQLRNPVPIDYELVLEKGRWLVRSSNVLWDESC